ncbi:FI22618p1 [Gryllus bimaculatus]|nr:FI22618p1 [Gryllus bimaculatus]
MQGPRDDPEPKIVNVFEVLKEAAAGAAFWNDSSVAACAGDIRRVMDGALARERWALMMVDATAKLPEPLLGGLTLHLGDYDQCLRARSQAFAGRYCLAAAMGQRIATCVPSTCTWRSLDALLANGSAGVVRVPAHTCQAAADPFAFHPALVAFGGCCIVCLEVGVCLCRVVVLLAVLNALGWFLLTYEGVRRRLPVGWQPSPETANAMSPVTAWRKISGAPDPRPRPHHCSPVAGGAGAAEAGSAGGFRSAAGAGDSGETQATVECVGAKDPSDWSWALPRMSAANGLRTLSMVWVVMGHRDALIAQLPVLDKRELPNRLKQWVHVYLPAGLFAVDTFLCLAGCVLAYSFACTRRRQPRSLRQLRSWLPTFYLHRYIRSSENLVLLLCREVSLGQGPRSAHQSFNTAPHRWLAAVDEMGEDDIASNIMFRAFQTQGRLPSPLLKSPSYPKGEGEIKEDSREE